MKRVFDIFLALLIWPFFLILMIIIGILVKVTSKGPVLHWSNRVGKNNIIYKMPKFRSMYVGAPNIATHLLDNANTYLTPVGSFLRQFSLDEIPQLFSVLKGDMSFVGPRPALFNQNDLIAFRTKNDIDKLLPGVTGWAQVNGRDELSIPDKVAFVKEYLHRMSFLFDLKILWLTLIILINYKKNSH